MHVFRHLQPGIGGFGGIEVVVARGDEHRRGNAPEGLDQALPGLKIGAAAVQQVAAEQHQIHPLAGGEPRQRVQQLPLLPPADGGLPCGQRLKGRVQMQVRRVQEFDRAHVSRIASAFWHLPVSGSMVKTQPSSLLGPLAES